MHEGTEEKLEETETEQCSGWKSRRVCIPNTTAKLNRFSQFTGPCGSQSPSAAQINFSAAVMLIYITAIGAGM
jgi:hypothetical protein